MNAIVRDGLKDVRPWKFDSVSARDSSVGFGFFSQSRTVAVKLINTNRKNVTCTVKATVEDGGSFFDHIFGDGDDSTSKRVQLPRSGGVRYVFFTCEGDKTWYNWVLDFAVDGGGDIPVEILERSS